MGKSSLLGNGRELSGGARQCFRQMNWPWSCFSEPLAELLFLNSCSVGKIGLAVTEFEWTGQSALSNRVVSRNPFRLCGDGSDFFII